MYIFKVGDDYFLLINGCYNIFLILPGIINLSRSCRHLHTVYLLRCINITDEAIINISANCPQLKYLNIGGCHQLTDSSLRALAQNSPNLECVNFAKTHVSEFSLIGFVF